jgi:hypothetical protein
MREILRLKTCLLNKPEVNVDLIVADRAYYSLDF